MGKKSHNRVTWILDIESNEWSKSVDSLDFKIGVFYRAHDGYYKVFQTQEEFINFLQVLLDSDDINTIYAHNLDFDAKFLFDWIFSLDEMKYCNRIIKSTSRLLSIKIFKIRITNDDTVIRTCKLSLRDSFALLPAPVSILGKIVNSEKIKIDLKTTDITKMIEYNVQDAKIVSLALERFCNVLNSFCTTLGINTTFDLTNLRLTLASTSKFIINKVTSNQLFSNSKVHQIYENILRNFYYGGRTEVFSFKKLATAYLYDINSLYPYVMGKYSYPDKFYYVYRWKEPKSIPIKVQIENTDIIAIFAIVNDTLEKYPFFASRIKDKLVFNNSVKECLIFREELEYLVKIGYLFSFRITGCVFGYQQKHLEKFVNEGYEIRKQMKANNNPEEYFIKILLNSGYGKFGEGREKIDYGVMSSASEMDENTTIEEYNENYPWLVTRTKKHSNFLTNNVLIAEKITAMARLELYSRIHDAISAGALLAYTDTDSLVLDAPVLPVGKNIGELKCETIYDFQALGLKEYIHSNAIICKGVKIHSKSELLAYFTTGIDISRPSKFLECIKKGVNFQSVSNFIKQNNTYFDKRVIMDDFSTIPVKNALANNEIILRKIIASI